MNCVTMSKIPKTKMSATIIPYSDFECLFSLKVDKQAIIYDVLYTKHAKMKRNNNRKNMKEIPIQTGSEFRKLHLIEPQIMLVGSW